VRILALTWDFVPGLAVIGGAVRVGGVRLLAAGNGHHRVAVPKIRPASTRGWGENLRYSKDIVQLGLPISPREPPSKNPGHLAEASGIRPISARVGAAPPRRLTRR
jgi:hypothetical protein